MYYLHSSDSDTLVKQVRAKDRGSHAQHARVSVQRVPAEGIIVSRADITIMGVKLFGGWQQWPVWRRISNELTKLLTPYDQWPFTLDGQMDLDISFADRKMTTPVYIKIDTETPLLRPLYYSLSSLPQQRRGAPIDGTNSCHADEGILHPVSPPRNKLTEIVEPATTVEASPNGVSEVWCYLSDYYQGIPLLLKLVLIHLTWMENLW